MNPFDRWDEWEWEKAAQEIGRSHRYDSWYDDYSPGSRRYYVKGTGSKSFMDKWTGSQKRVAMSALLFLTIVFSARGDDFISHNIYSLYQTGMDSGNLYVALNSMAKEAMGIPFEEESVKVNAPIEEIFYPPVAGAVKIGFEGQAITGKVSQGIEIESILGTPVLCPAEGVVLDVYEDKELGKVIRINFGDGWEGILGNMGEISVKQGEPVHMGLKLGTVGISSPREKPWLYFQLQKNNQPINPLPYLIQNYPQGKQ